MSSKRAAPKVVHLPVFSDNPYQHLLMRRLAERGLEVIEGGGGGNFLRTALFKWKADLYHFHWLHPYLLRPTRFSSVLRATRFIFEVLLLRLSGARVIWTIHNLVNHDRRFVKIERLYSSVFARLAGGFIVHSDYARREAMTTFAIMQRKPIAVIPQGSYAEHYPNRRPRAESRARLSFSDHEFVFLFFGRIERYKCIIELVREFRRLQKNARLVIAGSAVDSKLLDEIKETIAGADNVTLDPRFIDDDELQTYFNAADVFVFPVREILNSSSISLAMSFALPVIVPELESTREDLWDSAVLRYDPLDREGLLKAMTLAIERRDELPAMGSRNMSLARERNWRSVASRTEALYRAVLDDTSEG